MNRKLLYTAGAVGVGALAGAAVIENCCILQTARYKLAHPAYHGKPLRLLLISDLHSLDSVKKFRKIISQSALLLPDYILLPGDIVSRHCRDFSPVSSFLRSLAAIAPTFYSFGNHELDLPPASMKILRRASTSSGVILLDNKTFTPEHEFTVAGASLKRSVYKNEAGGYRNLERYTAEELTGAIGTRDGFTLLLAHNPLCMDAYERWGADLVFSGHIHGGSVRLPYVGGLLSPERAFFPEYDKGLYTDGNTVMLVSGGIGKPRFLNPPQLCLLSLHPNTD